MYSIAVHKWEWAVRGPRGQVGVAGVWVWARFDEPMLPYEVEQQQWQWQRASAVHRTCPNIQLARPRLPGPIDDAQAVAGIHLKSCQRSCPLRKAKC